MIVTMALFTSSACASIYNYTCTDRGQPYPLKVDDEQNILAWKGNVYKIKPQEDCGRMGWIAEKAGDSFEFCTATKGYADFEQGGRRIQCNLKR